MRFEAGKWLVVSVSMACAFAAHAGVSVTDSTGATVRLKAPARRILSLAPHTTELLYAAAAGDRLVGATEYSDYPLAARSLPRIGSYANIDIEAVVALHPDLVVGWQSGNRTAQVDKIRTLGVPVYLSEPRRLEDIATDIERLGELAGSYPLARAAAHRYRQDLASLEKRYANRPPVTVFYELWNPPLMTVNGDQIISDVIRLCGGINVFARLPVLAPSVDVEAVLHADPEVIFLGGSMGRAVEGGKFWRRWPQMRAVRNGNLFTIAPDLIQRQTPRLLQGAEAMCADLEQARARRPRPGGMPAAE